MSVPDSKPYLSIANDCKTGADVVATATWLELDDGTGLSDDTGTIDFYNGSDQVLLLGYGPSGSEQAYCYLGKGFHSGIRAKFPAGNRIVLKSFLGTTTTGEMTITFWGR